MTPLRRWWRQSEWVPVWAVVGTSVPLFGIFFWAENCGGAQYNPDLAARNFWIQLVTGASWPEPNQYRDNHCVAFCAAATAQTLVTTSAALAFIWVVLRTVSDRRKQMQVSNLIALRDNAIVGSVISTMMSQLPSTTDRNAAYDTVQKTVRGIFDQANKGLRTRLSSVVGDEEADRLIKSLENDV